MLHPASGFMQIQRNPRLLTFTSKDYDRLAHLYQIPREGYEFRGVRHITTATGQGYCWEWVRHDSSLLSIGCWFEGDTLLAAYGATPGYREQFYDALAVVSGASSQWKQQ
jgi:hypothetical protein